MREVQLMERLAHEFIIGLLEHVEIESRVFIFMELAPNGPALRPRREERLAHRARGAAHLQPRWRRDQHPPATVARRPQARERAALRRRPLTQADCDCPASPTCEPPPTAPSSPPSCADDTAEAVVRGARRCSAAAPRSQRLRRRRRSGGICLFGRSRGAIALGSTRRRRPTGGRRRCTLVAQSIAGSCHLRRATIADAVGRGARRRHALAPARRTASPP